MSQHVPTKLLPTERMDNLAREAVVTVFDSMVGEPLTWLDQKSLLEDPESDMIARLPLSEGIYTIVVSWVGDASGKVMLLLPRSAAEKFALKLFDVPSLDWLEDDAEVALQDTLGELGNMLVGLVKGGLTKWYPKLMLTTPKVMKNRRMKLDSSAISFRRQYLFEGFETSLMIDFCCE